eukprot:g27502.t1
MEEMPRRPDAWLKRVFVPYFRSGHSIPLENKRINDEYCLEPDLDLDAMLRPTSQVLQQSVDNFYRSFEQWTNQQTSNVDNILDSHKETVAQTKARIAQKEKEREALQTLLVQNKEDASQHQDKIQEMQENVIDLESKLSLLPQKLKTLKSQEETGHNEMVAKSKGVEELDKKSRDQIDALQKGINMFSDRLGLDFEQADGNFWMKFHLIDKANVEATYSLALVIDAKTYLYKVTQCIPPIHNMSELLDQLHLDNNFSRFVQRVRKSFVEIARAHPGAVYSEIAVEAQNTPPGELTPGEIAHSLQELSLAPAQAETGEGVAWKEASSTSAAAEGNSEHTDGC